MRENGFIIPALMFLAASLPVDAQEHADQAPAISASATGRVEIPADHAVLTLGVLVQDSTPTLAAYGMDTRLRALTDTLLALGFPPESLPTARYHLTPNMGRDRVRIVSYSANSAVRLTVWDITAIPAVIEASLAAGATDVTGLQFGASDDREARDEALRRALVEASRDARVLAIAAGGRLGDPIEISTTESRRPMMRASIYQEAARAGELSAGITPDAIVVEATVSGRWAFEKN